MLDRVTRQVRRGLRAPFVARGYSAARAAEAARVAEAWTEVRLRAARRRRGVMAGQEIVWPSPGRAVLRPFELLLAGPGEVSVQVERSVVSPGTERAHFLRLPNAQPTYPFRPGYSSAGTVIAVGPGVSSFAVGDRVALPRVAHASIATVPVAHVHLIPPGVELLDAAFVYLAMIAGYGLLRARIGPGEDVCVLGYGPVGALAQRLAAAAGARTVVITASRRREEAVRAGGADSFLLASDPLVASISAPVVVESTGDPEAIGTAVAACADGGRIILLGSSRGAAADLPVAAIRRKRLELVGAHISALPGEARRTGSDWMRELAGDFLIALAERRVKVDDLAGDRFDPREPEWFYRSLATDPAVLGGWLDWSLVPSAQRYRGNAVRRLPNLRAEGMAERDPLPPPDTAVTETSGEDLARAFGNHAVAGRERPLRIALLGCGDIGFANAHAIAGSDGAQLVACYDTVPELARNLAESLGARAAGSEDEVFEARDVDAVFISAPHHLHAPLASRAARSGLHVIVEKPLAHCLASAREIVQVTRDHGVALSVCFPFRYEEHVVAARELVEAGVLGVPRGALISYAADKPQSYWIGGYSGRAASDWRSRRSESGGGVLIMNLCHYFDLVRHLCGLEVDSVSATTEGWEDEGVEQSIAVSIRYEDGAVASVFGSSSVRGSAPGELRIWGADGQVVLEPEPRFYTLRALGGAQPGRWHALPEPGATNVRIRFVERFAAAVREQRPPDISGEDGLAVQAVIEAAYESARTGAVVRPADLLIEPVA